MPHSSRRIQQIAERLTRQKVDDKTAQFEERCQNLSQEFHAAQLKFKATQLQFKAVQAQHISVQKELVWLQQVVGVKQQVIEKLLPYYPHPLTPDLLYAIELY
jgi:hypothetical protein